MPPKLTSAHANQWFRWGFSIFFLLNAGLLLFAGPRGKALLLLRPLGNEVLWLVFLGTFGWLLGLWLVVRDFSLGWLRLCGFFLVAQTLLLGISEPMLLVHPLGILSKNYPFLLLLIVIFWLKQEGFSVRAWWLLRVSMALVWWTEGLFPKILFQQTFELGMVSFFHLDILFSPTIFLLLLGVGQILSGVVALFLRGSWLRLLLWGQLFAMLFLPLLVLLLDVMILVHPFAPLFKNIPICVGTYLLIRWSQLQEMSL